MKIIFDDEHPIVQQATIMSNSILKNSDFLNRIRQKKEFDLSTATPLYIADLIEATNLEFKIELFYPSGFRSIKYRKTFAYTDGNYPNTLFLNLKKLDREIEDIAATIIHESIHALDDECLEFTFGHGNNSSVGKDNTAPYWIGNLAYQILKNDFNAQPINFSQI